MTELQKRLLEIMKWFHNFCEQNNLQYYALGGTLIGAIRHKGFIPWDDDIDIGMPRNDYEQFIKLTFKKEFGNFIIESLKNKNKDYIWAYSKIYDKSTTFIEENKVKRGIFIDVFPIDGVCDKKLMLFGSYIKILVIKKIILSIIAPYRKRSFIKTIIVKILNKIYSYTQKDKLVNFLISIIAKKNKSNYVINIFGIYGYKEIVKRKILGTPKKYIFENIYIYGPEYYDDYLKNIYGNYMELPPLEKRIGHKPIELNLNKSFFLQ